MYKTGRRSGAGIKHFVRLQNDDDQLQSRHPLSRHHSDEDYTPIYYPLNPAKQPQPQQQQEQQEQQEQQPLPNNSSYAAADGYRSLMAFNSQQRTAGKPVKRERRSILFPEDESEEKERDRPSTLRVKGGASSLGYLFGGE